LPDARNLKRKAEGPKLKAMPRQESDREDLMREATALVQRAELAIAGEPEPVTCGFRRDGSASLFFGMDPVYQFNTFFELRRAYVGGLLYKADQDRLVSLTRKRTAVETVLLRHVLSPEETSEFFTKMNERLMRLRSAAASGQWRVRAAVPQEGEVIDRIRQWLAALPASIRVAAGANVR
jgi:hypothetical protein